MINGEQLKKGASFRNKNVIEKLWLKLTNKTEYKLYKWELKNYQQEQFYKFYTGAQRPTTIKEIEEVSGLNNNSVNVCHSGNAGDIIYSLPTVKRIHELTGANVNYYLQLGKPLVLSGYLSHPMGTVMLNQSMAEMLQPLIASQTYIHQCSIYTDETIHLDLDYFRSNTIPLSNSNIARWCGYLTGVSPELWKPWITAQPDSTFSNSILVARSDRYQNTSINYSFLSEYDNVLFIGIEAEFKNMRRHIPGLQWIKVDDFLSLAEIVAGCKLFIGNQSFPYSIAEALKVPRILEANYHLQNVIPEGENGNDFFFQKHFEWLVEYYTSTKLTKNDLL